MRQFLRVRKSYWAIGKRLRGIYHLIETVWGDSGQRVGVQPHRVFRDSAGKLSASPDDKGRLK